jgi:predicted dehydrogenase
VPDHPFRRITVDRPLRAIVVGAGGMGRGWIRTITASTIVDLAAVVDLNPAAAEAAVAELDGVAHGTSLSEVAGATGADIVVDVTIPEAHHAVTLEALGLGLPVLGEKPLAATLSEAVDLVRAAEAAGELFMVSQNRRYNPHLWTLKAHTQTLGRIGILTHEFFKAPHFGGFRDAMAHPLILDMAIHNFDAARFLLDADPVSVYCEEYNPSWSWYDGDAAATAIFQMSNGIRFIYTGSWCSEALETSWNSNWRVSGSAGSATWDGDNEPAAQLLSDAQPVAAPELPGEGLAGSLADFVEALRTGTAPMLDAHDNLQSLAMVHAAIESSGTGTQIRIADILKEAGYA